MPPLEKTFDVWSASRADSTEHEKIRTALSSILESHPFRSSKQCRDILSYIVEHSLVEEDGALRERVIGITVFGRPAHYNTSEDPVVRMRASDLRKRLAQYYQSVELGPEVPHITIPPGSYRATFRIPTPVIEATELEVTAVIATPPRSPEFSSPLELAEPIPSTSTRSELRGAMVGALCLVVLAATGFILYRSFQAATPLSAQQRFWAPILSAETPALIYLGSNAAYVFTPQYLAKYQQEHHVVEEGLEFFINLPPNSTVNSNDLKAVRNSFVTVGDLAATTQTVSLLNSLHKHFVLRSANDLSFGDLRNTPTVMIGGFNNPWTLDLTNSLPYQLHGGTRIVERDHQEHFWEVKSSNESPSYDDYAVITRLIQSKTGAPSMIIAGIGQNGTQAASEYLSDASEMEKLSKRLPPKWESMNLQIVLRVKVVDFLPSIVKVVATTSW